MALAPLTPATPALCGLTVRLLGSVFSASCLSPRELPRAGPCSAGAPGTVRGGRAGGRQCVHRPVPSSARWEVGLGRSLAVCLLHSWGKEREAFLDSAPLLQMCLCCAG